MAEEYCRAVKLLENYQPKSYFGEVALLRAREIKQYPNKALDLEQALVGLAADSYYGWGELLPKLRVISIFGCHDTLLDPQNAYSLRQALKDILIREIPNISVSREKMNLAMANENNDFPIVKLLLEQDPSLVNYKDDGKGWTPLHWAAYHGNKQLCEFLVSQGANLTLLDKNNQSAAMIAAKQEYHSLAYQLKPLTFSNIFLDEKKSYKLSQSGNEFEQFKSINLAIQPLGEEEYEILYPSDAELELTEEAANMLPKPI